MLETIGIIVALSTGIGGVVVSIVTQLNHVAHIRKEFDEHKAEDSSRDRRIWDALESIKDGVASIRADQEAMQAVCAERHRHT